MSEANNLRYRDEHVELVGPDGTPITGENLDVPSANPVNFHQAMTTPNECPPITIDGKLFLQPDQLGQSDQPGQPEGPQPLVMIVPGSLGVGPNHRAHAATLVANGYNVFVLDPFGARAVSSTVANQTQYSFAASGYDVLAAWKVLAADNRIDATRITAQGHSRGGSAVLTAAMRRFADPIIGEGNTLAGIYAVYPWCGYLFRDPSVGSTIVRSIIGDLDDWLSPQQVQGQIHAIAATGAEATIRIVPGACHSFDRLQNREVLDDAAVAPNAPAAFVETNGAIDSPYFEGPSTDLTDRDVFVAAMKAGHGQRGATIGSTAGQPELFIEDMLAFHHRAVTV